MSTIIKRPTIAAVPLIVPATGLKSRVRARGRWHVRFENPIRTLKSGRIIWDRGEFEYTNLVVNVGLDHLLDVGFSAGTQDTTWFIGLTDGTPTVAAGDTMASHAGWTEVTAYDEATREAFVEAGVSSQSISNVASPAAFTIDTNSTTIGGAFICGDSTKGGTSGILYAAGAFGSGDLVLNDGAALEVDCTLTLADDGV